MPTGNINNKNHDVAGETGNGILKQLNFYEKNIPFIFYTIHHSGNNLYFLQKRNALRRMQGI
jgi:hypothetical protein